jgi:uncharacterized membrane protein
MRFSLNKLSRRHANLLAGAVLSAFIVAVLLSVAAPALLLGGVAGWLAGAVLGLAAALALRRPCGILMGRLVGAG